jgi:hypothetical protein
MVPERVALMRARSFEVDCYGMGFGIPNVLHRVCCQIPPNSLPGGGSSLFGSTVWISKLKFGTAEDIFDARRVRTHWLANIFRLFPEGARKQGMPRW